MPSNWFHKTNGEDAGPFSVHGPLSTDQLKQLILKGDIGPDDLLRYGEDGEWVAARTVPGLKFGASDSPPDQLGRVVPPPRNRPATSPTTEPLPQEVPSLDLHSTIPSEDDAPHGCQTSPQTTSLSKVIGFSVFALGLLWAILSLSLWTISFLFLGTALAFIAYLTVCPTQNRSDFWNFEKARSFDSQKLGWGLIWGAISLGCIGLGVFGPIGPRGSLPCTSLDKSAVVLEGTFNETGLKSQVNWHGSAFVYERDGDVLRLYTNSHCLCLGDLAGIASQQHDRTANVTKYELHVTFPSGKPVPVKRIAESKRQGLDVACLEVDAKGLVEGKDYLIVPMVHSPLKKLKVVPGDDVIAVGAPEVKELARTQTFGKVSAFRNSNGVNLIQHDATIFRGNSGGPLFLKRGEFAYLIGINTSGKPGQSMSFALSADVATDATYEWTDATTYGAAQLIGQVYGVAASVGNGPRVASGNASVLFKTAPKLTWSEWLRKNPWVLRLILVGFIWIMSQKPWRK